MLMCHNSRISLLLVSAICFSMVLGVDAHAADEKKSTSEFSSLLISGTIPRQKSNVSHTINFLTTPRTLSRKLWLNWCDIEYYSQDLKIQQCVIDKRNFQVIGSREKFLFRGTLDDCREFCRSRMSSLGLKPFGKKIVVMLHGLWAPAWTMSPMKAYLSKRGHEAVIFQYPSTKFEIKQHAKSMHAALASLPKNCEISLISHSMGGIVSREYLAHYKDKRVKKILTLGTPHHGIELSTWISDSPLLPIVTGPAGKQLITSGSDYLTHLSKPRIPWGGIVGCANNNRGYSPFIKGDDDGIVPVRSALDPDMTCKLITHCMHHQLTKDKSIMKATHCFLEKNSFED